MLEKKKQSKRSRTSVSFETNEDPSKPSNPRNSEQRFEQNKRNISTNSKEHNSAAQPRQIPQLDLSKKSLTTNVANLAQTVKSISRISHITKQVIRKFTQNRTRSFLRRASISVTKMNLKKVETFSSKRNIHDNVKIILTKNLDGKNLDDENESKIKVHHFNKLVRHIAYIDQSLLK